MLILYLICGRFFFVNMNIYSILWNTVSEFFEMSSGTCSSFCLLIWFMFNDLQMLGHHCFSVLNHTWSKAFCFFKFSQSMRCKSMHHCYNFSFSKYQVKHVLDCLETFWVSYLMQLLLSVLHFLLSLYIFLLISRVFV